ncbi:hypothetical protein MPH47_14035 [Psychrobacillus psychrodurans]|uniref:hypothetical protein n=1 Tax=Psychrobacillus psychrodurans TaxID=126157 RepID=UPI001F4E762C|nr:hypothetical protein [Psychrobacillus psychrodurans]MCK1998320.1 hypothetical protein [Psychrobacillus psychrodurans]
MEKEHVYIAKGEGAGHIKAVDATELAQIKAEGRGYVMNMGEFQKYESKATELLNNFKSFERKVKASENPADTYESKQWQIAQAEKELDAQIKEIESEWTAKKEEIVEAAKQSAATYSINVSSSDEQLAKQFANRHALNLVSRPSVDSQREALMKMESDIERLTDAQRTALIPHLLTLSSVVKDGVSVGNVLRAASEMTTPELVQAKAAEAMPFRVATAYHQLKLIRESHRNSIVGNMNIDKR